MKAWKVVVEWLMFAHNWRGYLQRMELGELVDDPITIYSVWKPAYKPGQTILSKQLHKIDETHPWVIKQRTILWRDTPQVMLRACSSRCFKDGS